MRRSSWSVQDAKNQFSVVVEAAKRQPQTVTKHGKPTAVVVGIAEYERLKQLEQTPRKSFVEHLLSMPKDDGEFERLEGDLRPID